MGPDPSAQRQLNMAAKHRPPAPSRAGIAGLGATQGTGTGVRERTYPRTRTEPLARGVAPSTASAARAALNAQGAEAKGVGVR